MNLTKEIVIGISKVLKDIKANVYVDEVKSNLRTPAFVVKRVTHSYVRYPNERFYKRIPFQVVYIPDDDENSSFELYSITDKLNQLLEVIELRDGSLIRGLEISSEVVDNVLYFYITYQAFEHTIKDEVKMDRLEFRVEVDE